MLVASVALGACGGSTDGPADRAAGARAYASAVARTTQATERRLTELSDRADYADGARSAATTRAYAQAIADAASSLRDAAPPAAVAARHRELVDLYAGTARRLEGIATALGRAADPDDLARQTRRLAAEIGRLSARETDLRAAIQRGLVAPG